MSKKIVFLVFFAFAIHAMDKPIEERLLEKNIVKPAWIIGNDESVRWKLDRSSALHSRLVKFQADMNPENSTFFFPLHLPTDKIDFFLRTLCKRYPPTYEDPTADYLAQLSQFSKQMAFNKEFDTIPPDDLIAIAQVAHAVDEPKLLEESIDKCIMHLDFITLNGYEPQKTFLTRGTIDHELPDPISSIIYERMIAREGSMLIFWSLLTEDISCKEVFNVKYKEISDFNFVDDTHLIDNDGFVWDLKKATHKSLLPEFSPTKKSYSLSNSDSDRLLITTENTIKIFDRNLTQTKCIKYARQCNDKIPATVNCTGSTIAFVNDGGAICIQNTFNNEYGRADCRLLEFSWGNIQLQFHPNDPQCLFSLYPDRGMLWSTEMGRPVKILIDGMKLPLITGKFSPCGNKLLLISEHGIYIWNITLVHPDVWDSSRKKKKLPQINPNYAPPTTDIESSLETKDAISAAEYNSDGSLIATTHAGSIRIWTANLINQLRHFKINQLSQLKVLPAQFSPNGQQLAIGMYNPRDTSTSVKLYPLVAESFKELTLTQIIFLNMIYKNIMSKNTKKINVKEYPAIAHIMNTLPKNLAQIISGFVCNSKKFL